MTSQDVAALMAGSLGIVLYLFLFVLVLLWVLLPIVVYVISRRVLRCLEELQKLNAGTQGVEIQLRKLRQEADAHAQQATSA